MFSWKMLLFILAYFVAWGGLVALGDKYPMLNPVVSLITLLILITIDMSHVGLGAVIWPGFMC